MGVSGMWLWCDSVAICSFLEQLHAILKFTNLLRFKIFIHALPFQPACTSTLTRTVTLYGGLT